MKLKTQHYIKMNGLKLKCCYKYLWWKDQTNNWSFRHKKLQNEDAEQSDANILTLDYGDGYTTLWI